MQSTFSEGPRRLFRDSYNPLTNALIAAMIVVFLSAFVGSFSPFNLVNWLVAVMPEAIYQPWRLLTFSVVETNIIGLIFSALALFWVGGSLERGWGTRTFAIFFVCICLVVSAAFLLVSLLTQTKASASGSLVIAALLVGWAMLNPDETIHLYGIIPIKSRFLALGVVLIIFFTYGWGNPLVGFLALSGCGFAALWAKNGWAYRFMSGGAGFSLPRASKNQTKTKAASAPHLRLVPPKNPRPKDDRFTIRDLNPMEFFAKRKRRKQFEKLMRDD